VLAYISFYSEANISNVITRHRTAGVSLSPRTFLAAVDYCVKLARLG